jgi:hypothetical protein
MLLRIFQVICGVLLIVLGALANSTSNQSGSRTKALGGMFLMILGIVVIKDALTRA